MSVTYVLYIHTQTFVCVNTYSLSFTRYRRLLFCLSQCGSVGVLSPYLFVIGPPPRPPPCPRSHGLNFRLGRSTGSTCLYLCLPSSSPVTPIQYRLSPTDSVINYRFCEWKC